MHPGVYTQSHLLSLSSSLSHVRQHSIKYNIRKIWVWDVNVPRRVSQPKVCGFISSIRTHGLHVRTALLFRKLTSYSIVNDNASFGETDMPAFAKVC